MFKKVEKLVLRGSVWLRAKGQIGRWHGLYYRSNLFTKSTGRMCCVGVLGAACGIPKRLMEGQGTPSGVINNIRPPDEEHLESAYEYRSLSPAWGSFYEANDDPHTTDEEKISLLTPLFAEMGIELEFRPDL